MKQSLPRSGPSTRFTRSGWSRDASKACGEQGAPPCRIQRPEGPNGDISPAFAKASADKHSRGACELSERRSIEANGFKNKYLKLQKHFDGFSLIECLVYCAVLGILSLLIFSFFARSSLAAQQFSADGKLLMSLYATHDLLARDLQQAWAASALWDVSSSHSFVFKTNMSCVGWKCKKNNLYRSTGDYDFSRGKWQHKSTALVMQNIIQFKYTLHKQGASISGITSTLDAKNKSLTRKTFLYNQVVA